MLLGPIAVFDQFQLDAGIDRMHGAAGSGNLAKADVRF